MSGETPYNIKSLVDRLIVELKKPTFVDETGKLPSEHALMHQFGVTRYSLRQALSRLSDMGIIYRSQGLGSFIRSDSLEKMAESVHNIGLSGGTKTTNDDLTTVEASQRIVYVSEADFLPKEHQLNHDEQLIEVNRLRSHGDSPYLVEKSYYIHSLIQHLSEETLYGSIFFTLEHAYKFKLGFIDKHISCEPLGKSGSVFFDLPIGAPTLVERDDTYLKSGKLLAFSKISYDYRQAELFMTKQIH